LPNKKRKGKEKKMINKMAKWNIETKNTFKGMCMVKALNVSEKYDSTNRMLALKGYP